LEFEWDANKHERNIREKGFGFGSAAKIFDGRIVERQDVRFDYLEVRMIAVGTSRGTISDRRLHNPRRQATNYCSLAGESEREASVGKITRMTLEEIKRRKPTIDYAKFDSLTEEDIRRFQIEEGYDPDASMTGWRVVEAPATIRERLGMSQEEFAKALQIPEETVRNWELGKDYPDPVAQSLLRIVAKDPEAALKALAS
jgi:putative transcriptional regulator